MEQSGSALRPDHKSVTHNGLGIIEQIGGRNGPACEEYAHTRHEATSTSLTPDLTRKTGKIMLTDVANVCITSHSISYIPPMQQSPASYKSSSGSFLPV